MRRATAAIFLSLALLSACGGPSPVPENKVPVPAASMFFEREATLCNTPHKLLIGYYGQHLLDTTTHLYILGPAGDTLYRDLWPTRHMLPDTALPDTTLERLARQEMRLILDGKKPHTTPDSTPHAFSYAVRSHARALQCDPATHRIKPLP